MATIETPVIEINEVKSPKNIYENYVIPCLKENDFIVDKLVENIENKSTLGQYETESDRSRDNYFIKKIQHTKYDGDSSSSSNDDNIRAEIRICKFISRQGVLVCIRIISFVFQIPVNFVRISIRKKYCGKNTWKCTSNRTSEYYFAHNCRHQ